MSRQFRYTGRFRESPSYLLPVGPKPQRKFSIDDCVDVSGVADFIIARLMELERAQNGANNEKALR